MMVFDQYETFETNFGWGSIKSYQTVAKDLVQLTLSFLAD